MVRILVVDDTDDIRLLVTAVLRRAGFEVDSAADGREALDVVVRGEPADAVILDVQMPEVDGWTVLDAIRTDRRWAEVPVVLCTVKSQAADMRRGWQTGCDAFLTKPFDIEELVNLVCAVIARDQHTRESIRAEALAETLAEAAP
ncbi:MAG: response regulator [Acidimicrobiales bacterium]